MKLKGFICWPLTKLMNRHIDKELKKKGVDIRLPNPYLTGEYDMQGTF